MNKVFDLTPLDRRILRVLQQDGGVSNAALAEQVGASAASCWRRVKALEDAGVLRATVRLVDAQSVGCDLDVFCQIRMKIHDLKSRQSFERFIHAQPETVECYSISGEWDYLLHMVIAGVHDYERLLMDGILAHPAIATSSSVFALKRVKYSTALPV